MSQIARFLAIAPYQGLKNSLLEAAKALPGVHLDVIVANLEAAGELLSTELLQNYDVLISRGGTAELIRRMTHVPVVQINISILDMLRMIQTARQSDHSFAIVGFDNITRPARIVAELLHFDLPIVEIHGEQEAKAALSALAQQGHTLIVGDVITVNVARFMGLSALLVNSGEESAAEALADALSIFNSLCALRHETEAYAAILEASGQALLYRDAQGEVRCQTRAFKDAGLPPEEIPQLCAAPDGETLYEHEEHVYKIRKTTIRQGEQAGQALFVDRLPQYKDAGNLRIRKLTAVERAYCLYDRGMARAAEAIIGPGAESRSLCVYGGPGTERELMARYLHCRLMAQSQSDSFFVTVDSELLKGGGWPKAATLLLEYAQKAHVSLYFHDIHLLDPQAAGRLAAFLRCVEPMQQCVRLFSSTKTPEQLSLRQELPDELLQHMNGPALHITPLHKRAGSIPAICSVMIGKCNTRYGRQVVGL